MKQHYRGMTLVEILLALSVISLILGLILPKLLQESHEKSVDKTVSEMSQIVLAARNYYQDKQAVAPGGTANSSNWPQNLQALVNENYIPSGLLCSSVPATTSTTPCGNHQPYVLFPSNGGQYDKSVAGIAASSPNGGGNFWGVSVTLPNARIAEEVRQKMPFASRCSIADLKSGVACKVDDTNTTVTAIVPRPAIFAQSNYAIDGLIQTMGSIAVCGYNGSYTCDSKTDHGGNGNNIVSISMPATCGVAGLKPILFVYPFDMDWNGSKGGTYPGITVQTTRDDTKGQWKVAVAVSGNTININGSLYFNSIYLAYFTVCAPNSDDANKWDASSFIGYQLINTT